MLNVAVIGCGAISVIHREAIDKNPDALLVSVCDIKKIVANDIAAQHQCKAYTDYQQMLETENLDIVHICTPHYLHKEMIIKALSLDINVICEKPVVMNMQESEEVQIALKETTAKLAITFQNRYNPTSLVMKRYVDKGELGKLLGIKGYVSWFRTPEYYTESDWRGKYATEGGGFLINQGLHTVDLIQWLGGELEYIEGSYSTRALKDCIEVEDTSEIYFKFKNGAIGIFYGTNAYAVNSPVEMELLFEKGLLKYMNGKLYIETDDQNFLFLERDFKAGETEPSYWGASHEKAINSFYQSVNGVDDYIPFNEGIKAIGHWARAMLKTQITG